MISFDEFYGQATDTEQAETDNDTVSILGLSIAKWWIGIVLALIIIRVIYEIYGK